MGNPMLIQRERACLWLSGLMHFSSPILVDLFQNAGHPYLHPSFVSQYNWDCIRRLLKVESSYTSRDMFLNVFGRIPKHPDQMNQP